MVSHDIGHPIQPTNPPAGFYPVAQQPSYNPTPAYNGMPVTTPSAPINPYGIYPSSVPSQLPTSPPPTNSGQLSGLPPNIVQLLQQSQHHIQGTPTTQNAYSQSSFSPSLDPAGQRTGEVPAPGYQQLMTLLVSPTLYVSCRLNIFLFEGASPIAIAWQFVKVNPQ